MTVSPWHILARISLPLLGLMVLSGCTGTLITRSHSEMRGTTTAPHSMFGGYPFQAVVVDFQIENSGANESDQPIGPVVSLAFDLVADLVLSPIDLVAWALGHHKRSLKPSP